MDKLYQARVDRVIDYIQTHLEQELTVADLASLACFSEHHFNRLFKQRVGESLYQFVRRLRLEKAARLLACETRSVTEVALSCGFANSAAFAKSFKQQFELSASEWRERYKGEQAAMRRALRDHQPELGQAPVEIEQIEPAKIAYVRNIGDYVANAELFHELHQRLFCWAGPRGLALSPSYNLYHDNRFITPDCNLRVMVALAVPEQTQPHGDIGVTHLSGGAYAVRRYYLREDEFSEAWDWMTGIWPEQNGYQADDDRELLERCIGEVAYEGLQFYEVDICVPVKPI